MLETLLEFVPSLFFSVCFQSYVFSGADPGLFSMLPPGHDQGTMWCLSRRKGCSCQEGNLFSRDYSVFQKLEVLRSFAL